MNKADMLSRMAGCTDQTTAMNLMLDWLNTNGHSDIVDAVLKLISNTVTVRNAHLYKVPVNTALLHQ